MGKTPPGETRQKVFAFVRERLLAGRPPTVREVQEALGFRAVQTARQHLEGLVAEGRLAADRGVARGYRLPGRGRPPVLIPLLGRVPAGPLDTAVEDREGYLPAAPPGEGEELFALRVQGESMTGAGLLPGDVVIVRRQPTARSGQIVVARVGDEATVKRLRLRRGRPELHPENPTFEVLVPDPAELEILGVVVELRRRM
ncbi:MAG: transcriptional repressor LexA [Thermodesulfobacteriota bacterium]